MRLLVHASLWLALLLGSAAASATDAPPAPAFAEVYQTVKEHLPGISESDLNEAAVAGLLGKLEPRVSLVPAGESSASVEALVTQTNLFQNAVVYLRVGQVAAGLAEHVRRSFEAIDPKRRAKGLILDLRYAGGTDYEAAAMLVDQFLRQECPILDWGKGIYKSRVKDNDYPPIVVLVNAQTSAAAEAVAAAIRDTRAGLILGNRTAGKAWLYKDFPLTGGPTLRIAQGTVLLGSGKPLPEAGVKPDIAVTVPEKDELAYFADSYAILPSSATTGRALGVSTNQLRRPEINEAELVRSRKAGSESEPPRRNPLIQVRLVSDPVLARALDLLKGLALVRESRS